jgi:predicted RNase H-like HicB family nuclease
VPDGSGNKLTAKGINWPGGSVTKHEVVLYWSQEDGAFIAEVPELAGCAADGATRQEALANVEQVIAEWIETARELGRPVPEPKGRLFA